MKKKMKKNPDEPKNINLHKREEEQSLPQFGISTQKQEIK